MGQEKLVRTYFGTEQQSGIGGLPLLAELEVAVGLVAGAAAVLRDWRAAGQITYSLAHFILQKALLICAGYEDGIDSNFLADDPAVKMALSIGLRLQEPQELASQSSVCRFENDFGAFNCYRLAFFLFMRYILLHKKPPKSIRLDFDGSCFRTRGEQEGTAYRKYYNTKMYFPLFVFDQDGFLITAILRPGDNGEAELVVPVLKRMVRAFRKEWPKVEITIVMDAAFNDPKIYDWCEDNKVQYLIKLKAPGKPGGGLFGKSHKLARKAKIGFTKKYGQPRYADTDLTKNSVETEFRKLEKTERKQKLKELERRVVRRYDSFEHQTGKGGQCKKGWRHERRVLACCIYDDWGERRSFWVTNIVGLYPEHLIENVYSARGKAELFIKDAKAFRCDKMSCENFIANQTRLLVQVLAYQLMFLFRSRLPKSMRSMTLASVSLQFIRVPVLVKEKARITDLVFSDCFAWKNHMHALLDRLTAQPVDRKDWLLIWLGWLKPFKLAPALLRAA
jgi:hypothetical protein